MNLLLKKMSIEGGGKHSNPPPMTTTLIPVYC